ncbi:MAG: DUF1289 domain-containing protein [Candidatus Accumulibacter sp. 66-26]|nr:MAG: DUF1289 domain-containing protein [Candidatus Accumulibacter sp. 66-26]
MSVATRGEAPAFAASPCINVCRMDAESGLCTGCLRTLDEIAGWARASNDARLAILAEVERRRGVPAAPRGAGERA